MIQKKLRSPKQIVVANILVLFILVNLAAFLPSSFGSSSTSSGANSIFVVKNPYTAGYGATGPNYSVTSVNGSWIQPELKCGKNSNTVSAAGFAVQIDGFNGKDIEIVGTGGGCINGRVNYVAFYSFYPATGEEFFANLVISPGDRIFASVQYSVSSGIFTARIVDLSTGKSSTAKSEVNGAQRNSVEAGVISVENSSAQCCLALTKFSKVGFGADKTQISATCFATISGVNQPIGSFPTALELVMTNVNGTAVRAQPSTLSGDNSSFTITWKSSEP
jgi:hypothetical protein